MLSFVSWAFLAQPGSDFFNMEGDHVRRYLWASEAAKGKTVIDIGCGHGYGSYFLSSGIAKEVIGIDSDSKAIEFAKSHYRGPNLFFSVVDVCSEEPTAKFDMAISFEVLEHLVDADAYFAFVDSL